ncbi:phosphoglycerate mutase [Histoplasma capsulatum H143]|uniref:Phosphoglycerate mutase n=1 Tax=Ajellomyces capsulatus (strain H143) TaxID=544712 RepID=C6HPH1_AJECH|nr:phosphoglycerate mutase [Histoplasma capsulatum H143]
MGYASPTFFSADADTNSTDPTLPSPNSDDSIQRLNWVRSTLKDLALARAAKDTRPVSQKTKQMDASIELYLQLQNDLSSGFQEECAPAAQSMVWQPSSTTISDSSFDNNSFSLTGSPGSSTGTVPELSPASITRVGSASAGPSRPTPLPASGGVQMVLDMNLNETTSLPRKHRPKTQEERQRYIAVRRQGACEWHRKQRKRCTCVDKTNSALTTAKRKKLMKHVQTSQQHCSSAVTPASAGDRWRRTNVRPCSGPLRSSPTPQVCLIPKSTWRCDGALSCTDPECLECCGNEEPIAQRLQVVVQSSVDCQRHKPYINRGTLELIEWQPWGEPSDDHRRYTLLPPVRESLEPASQAQRAIQSRLQTTTVPGIDKEERKAQRLTTRAPPLAQLLRETLGVHTCDRRSAAAYIAKTYPNYTLEAGFAPTDPLWDPDLRESDSARTTRLRQLVDDIVERDSGASMLETGGVIPVLVRIVRRKGAADGSRGAVEPPQKVLECGEGLVEGQDGRRADLRN